MNWEEKLLAAALEIGASSNWVVEMADKSAVVLEQQLATVQTDDHDNDCLSFFPSSCSYEFTFPPQHKSEKATDKAVIWIRDQLVGLAYDFPLQHFRNL